ncbi:MAG: hypothetical protein ACEQSX_03865 [Baekduiaceae bacterium]
MRPLTLAEVADPSPEHEVPTEPESEPDYEPAPAGPEPEQPPAETDQPEIPTAPYTPAPSGMI